MFSHLQGRRVNLHMVQEFACRKLIDILDGINGSKAIVFDDALLAYTNLIATPTFFSDRSIKLFKLETEMHFPPEITNIIFIVRSSIKQMNIIAESVKQHALKGQQYHMCFVPRKSELCIKQLEEKGSAIHFSQYKELPWNFYPLDADVVSMESETAYRDVSINGDPSILYQAAVGLVQLQCLYGRIPKIYGKGNMSKHTWDLAKQLGADETLLSNGEKSIIDQIILLDRNIDLMSALATQLTYEGLIDEFFGIQQNQLSLPVDIFSSINDSTQSSPTHLTSDKKRIIPLNSAEELYAELRDKNFNEVGKILARSAKEISQEMNSNYQDNSVQGMKQLVDKLPNLLARKQSVAVHTTIAEIIRKHLDANEFSDDLAAEQEFIMCENTERSSVYIEDLIAKQADLKTVLRLICMQCVAASGFKEKVLNNYKRELVHVYGLEVLMIIDNLEKANLIYLQTNQRNYAMLRKTLKLTTDDAVEINPTDISYVHSFFAPLTARLVQHSLKPLGWQSLKSHISNLPGQTFEDFQAQLTSITTRHISASADDYSLNLRRIIMVFFVGGCTFAEIAALRFLAKQEDNNVEFIIATTKIINKNTFINSFI